MWTAFRQPVFRSVLALATTVAFMLPGHAAAAAQASVCTLLTDASISETLGSTVPAGVEFAGPEVCRWSNDERPITTVLLTVRPAGSLREGILCGEMRAGQAEGVPVEGIDELAFWQFENVIGLFNRGELITCGPQGYISLSVSMERDEPTLRQAALSLFNQVQSQL
jgi:hypothetical protein